MIVSKILLSIFQKNHYCGSDLFEKTSPANPNFSRTNKFGVQARLRTPDVCVLEESIVMQLLVFYAKLLVSLDMFPDESLCPDSFLGK